MGDIIGSAIGAVASHINAGINYGASLSLGKKARAENYMYGEMAADAADRRTRALYNDIYSPGALLQQYQEAGLSPSLMFGGTPGQGGMQGAKGTGASGPMETYAPISLLEGAQAAALWAQAAKTKAETETIEGKNEYGLATIAKTWAEAGHNEAAAAAQKASAAGMELDNYVKENTKEANIYTICELAEKTAHEATTAYNQAKSAKIQADYDQETYQTRVDMAKKELDVVVQSLVESKSRVELNKQQKQNLRNDVLVSFDTVAQKWKELDIKEKEQTTYTDWIEAQMPYIKEQLDLKLKELGIQNRRVWMDGITNIIKGLCIGAGMAAQFGKGSNATKLPPEYKPQGSEIWY